MILNCNSCNKKFVVPDTAITISGRMVQCGSCGNKWKQFPINAVKQSKLATKTRNIVSKPHQIQSKIQKTKKVKKSVTRKPREINLYSPEYLQKKHGIKLNNVEKEVSSSSSKKVSFGFYNSLLLFIVVVIFISRGLYFSQEFVVQKFPFTEFYIDYFFESIRNMFEIFKNLISNY